MLKDFLIVFGIIFAIIGGLILFGLFANIITGMLIIFSIFLLIKSFIFIKNNPISFL
jgi:hypothetical protein